MDVDEDGWSPITLAAEQGQTEILQIILDAGASVDSKNHVGGWRALHCAAANGHIQIVKTLISAGASLDVEVCNMSASSYVSKTHTEHVGHKRRAPKC